MVVSVKVFENVVIEKDCRSRWMPYSKFHHRALGSRELIITIEIFAIADLCMQCNEDI